MAACEVLIPFEGVTFEESWNCPDVSENIVLFAHGSGSSGHSQRNRFVAQMLRHAGLGTLLFDLMTQEEEQAEGATRCLRFNIEFLAERLTGATEWVLSRYSSEKS